MYNIANSKDLCWHYTTQKKTKKKITDLQELLN